MNLPKPSLIVVTGKPGCGKTTLCKALADVFNIASFGKDGILEILFENIGLEPDEANTPQLVGATYGIMAYAVRQAAVAGASVIIESNFNDAMHSSFVSGLAADLGLQAVQVFCDCDSHLAFTRFKDRADRGDRHPLHPRRDTFEDYERVFLGEKSFRLSIDPCVEVRTDDFAKVNAESIARQIVEAV